MEQPRGHCHKVMFSVSLVEIKRQHYFSRCCQTGPNVPPPKAAPSPQQSSRRQSSCLLMPSRYSSVPCIVILIIDALKFDFCLHNDSLVNPKPYQNKLPVLQVMCRLSRYCSVPCTVLQVLFSGKCPGTVVCPTAGKKKHCKLVIAC